MEDNIKTNLQNGMRWTGLFWLRLGTSSGLLYDELSGSIK